MMTHMELARVMLVNAKREYRKTAVDSLCRHPDVSLRYWEESIKYWTWVLNRKAV